jgi:TonB family protein
MTDLLEATGTFAASAFWLPLGLWTIAVLGVLGLTMCLRLHPGTSYRHMQILLLALPAGILLSLLAPLRILPAPAEEPAAIIAPALIIEQDALPIYPLESGSEAAAKVTAIHLAGAFTLAAWFLGLVSLIYLLGNIVSFLRLQRSISAKTTDFHRDVMDAARSKHRIRRPVGLVLSDGDLVPMTFGVFRPTVVLPRSLAADPERFRLALEHEIVHVKRQDYAWNLAECVVTSAFVFHPLIHLIRRRTATLRELSCDAAVLQDAPGSRQTYAELLLNFARPAPVYSSLALEMAKRPSEIKTRISKMKNIPRPPRFKILSMTASAAMMMVLVGAMAVRSAPPTAHMEYDQVQLSLSAPSDTVFVIVEEMPEMIGGLASIQRHIIYPEGARADSVEGRVHVEFVVGSDGVVRDMRVVQSPDERLSQAALDAMQHARFTPGRQRGVAVPVRLTLPITFRLNESHATIRFGEPGDRPRSETDIFWIVEEMPELVGGMAALQEAIEYPEMARRAGVEGRVHVEFVVDPDGNVRDARVVRGAGAGLDEEALRVVRAARFIPGRQRGQAVHVRMTLPITFRLGGSPAPEAQNGERSMRIEILRQADDGIQGRVVDATSGEPLVGANVVLTGTTIGGATDRDGRFALRFSPGQSNRLRASITGYSSVEARLTAETRTRLVHEITIDGDGSLLYVRRMENSTSAHVSSRELTGDQLRAELRRNPPSGDDIVSLRVHPDARMGTVNDVQQTLRQSGLTNIRLETLEP